MQDLGPVRGCFDDVDLWIDAVVWIAATLIVRDLLVPLLRDWARRVRGS